MQAVYRLAAFERRGVWRAGRIVQRDANIFVIETDNGELITIRMPQNILVNFKFKIGIEYYYVSDENGNSKIMCENEFNIKFVKLPTFEGDVSFNCGADYTDEMKLTLLLKAISGVKLVPTNRRLGDLIELKATINNARFHGFIVYRLPLSILQQICINGILSSENIRVKHMADKWIFAYDFYEKVPTHERITIDPGVKL